MRVLMLGWEFPPVVSGGLGVATEGLVRGLIENGVEVVLVLPDGRPRSDEPEGGFLRILSAAEPAQAALGTGRRPSTGSIGSTGSLRVRTVPSLLRPYVTAAAYRNARRSRRPEGGRRHAAATAREPYGLDLRAEVVRYAEAAAAIARRERFDVIHAHDWLTLLAGLAARTASGKPLAAHVHATEIDRAGERGDPFVSGIETLGWKAADRVIAVSAYTAGVLESRYGVPKERIRVVHNALDAPAGDSLGTSEVGSRRTEAEAETETSDTAEAARAAEPLVLFAGRVTWQKGPEHFVEAAALVAREMPRARFVVAGAGDRLRRTADRAAALGLAGRFEFTGFLDRGALDRLYETADVYVMPSVSEPFGLTALEALRHGVPVILSRHAGVSEVAPDVLRVDFDDARDLASKILSVLLFPALSTTLARRGRHDIDGLSWKRSAARCLDVYREMRAPSGSGTSADRIRT